MASVVEVRGLTKVYRSFLGGTGVRALNDLTLDVNEGETFGIVGPNGSGKTTCLKLLLGLIYPTAGNAKLFGYNVGDGRGKRLIGYMPEAPYFYDHLTGEQLLRYMAQFFGLKAAEQKARVDDLLNLVGMTERRDMLLRHYSRGMLQRIGLAQALLNDPQLLILDEPTSGLDPVGAYQIRSLIVELNRRGKTILLCSHLLNEVEAVCDRVGVLYRGNLKACGTLDELLPPPSEVVLVVAGLEAPAVARIEELGAACAPTDGMVRITAPPDKSQQLLELVQRDGGTLHEMQRPRMTLEQVFMDMVREEAE
ncbi:MAG: ABC transporter ATP-binding protein [Armatimonadota bacterium]|nr:MAG: ABC transporter ATP-binding protein [Armatimonadota bacterium]